MRSHLLIAALFLSGLAMAQEKQTTDSTKANNIQEVLMTKKVFKKESDRFVYDVANSPVAKGNTIFEILKQTPLLSSTDDKTVTIAGKSSAIIFIDGRKTNMDAESLSQFLKNTPAENIQKIEVITIPGSEYQVDSSDGIINIVLKKRKSDGLNGNLRLANTQNKYNGTSASGSINYRKDKLGVSANLTASTDNQAQHYILRNGNNIISNESVGNITDPNKNIGGYVNIDYQLNDNSNLAFSWNSWANRSYNSKINLFNTVISPSGTNYSISRNNENSRSYNNSFNINYELKTDTLGSKLKINAAYLNFKRFQNSDNRTLLSNIYQNDLGIGKQVIQDLPQLIDNFSGTIDYIKKMKNDFTISVGANYNHTKTDNNTNIETYFLVPPSAMISEPNHFIYSENIIGAYLTLDKKLSEKFSGKLGARYEMTNSLGTSDNAQNPDYRRIERNYNNFLPYLSLNYAINENNNISYAFSSRMRRPSFWELNPVRNILTDYNYTQNDPFVKAASNYNQELTYMYKNSYFLILNHSYKKDIITQVPLQRDIIVNGIQQRELRYIRTNFGDKQEMSAVLSVQKSLFKQYWSTNFNIGLQHNINDGSLSIDPTTGEIFPTFVNKGSSTSLIVQMSNNIRLDKAKTWFLGVTGFYVDRQQIELGMLKNLATLDINVKKILNNWTFSLDLKDILRTHIIEIESFQNNGDYNYLKNDQYRRGASLSVVYSFGNQKIKKIRTLDNAANEIKGRTN